MLKSGHPGFGELLVLVDGTAAHAYGAGDLVAAHQHDSAREDDDPAVVGRLEAVERLSRLRHLCQVPCRHLERGRGESLVNRDVYAAQPGVFHTRESLQVPAVVHDSDVHGLADLLRLLHGSLDDLLYLLEQDRGCLAELTYACPLHCPYCSNPLNLADYREELTTADWQRVMAQARALGVLQLHLSGGEPLQRRDLAELVAIAQDLGLYTNLITSALGLSSRRAEQLKTPGLDHVQISFPTDEPTLSDRIAGTPSYERKMEAAHMVAGTGLGLLGFSPVFSAAVFGTITAVMTFVGLQLGGVAARIIPIRSDLLSGVGLLIVAIVLFLGY